MSEYGYCHLSCVPVRAEAFDRSEMVNQLLFGETYMVVDAYKNWKIIRGSLDHYEGFMDEKQFLEISPEQYDLLQTLPDQFPVKTTSWLNTADGSRTLLMPGSSLRGFTGGAFSLGQFNWTYADAIEQVSPKASGASIAKAAQQFVNAPYLWGGRTLTGIDCSGLVQNVFKMNGIALHRDAAFQSRQGLTLNLLAETLPGDLAFFDNEEGAIVHVGIILEDSKIIHASGHVRIDTIDHHGIYNRELKKYTHKLRLLKRIIQ